MISVVVKHRCRDGIPILAMRGTAWPQRRWLEKYMIESAIYPDPQAGGGNTLRSILDLVGPGRKLDIIAADIIDGTYNPYVARALLDAASIHTRKRGTSTLTGCSINKWHPFALDSAKKMPENVRFCIRDHESAERFGQTVGHNYIDVADLAFLVDPSETLPGDLEARILHEKSKNRPVVGLNLNPHQIKDSAALCKNLIHSLKKYIPNVFIVGIGHDTRFIHGANDWSSFANTGIDCIIPENIEANEIRRLTSLLDVLISGRMHAAILASSSGCPPLCLSYVGKFEGFFKKIGLDPATLVPAHEPNIERITQTTIHYLQHQDRLRNAILSRMPSIRVESLKNLC
jgi:hypothetical protein